MSFRTVVIKSRCKLEYSLNFLIYRGEEEKHICLDEITTLIIENQQVSITSSLLSRLCEKKIKVIFCDEKHNPQFELTPYYSNYETYTRIIEQTKITPEAKDSIWKEIIKEKISSEIWLLKKKELDDKANQLSDYLKEVQVGDITNREGHAAKVYFNALFGNSFSRENDCDINLFLNYGYSIIVSQINREIKSAGYLTEVGIHHIGNTNPFNLSYDIFEPLRALVDSYVVFNKVNRTNYRDILQDLLSIKVKYSGAEMYLDNAIPLYTRTIIRAGVTNDMSIISFIEYEF